MNIIHYSLGLYPQRNGGMSIYCTDLIKQQNELGHHTFLMKPGGKRFFGRKVKFTYSSNRNIDMINIINGPIIPLLYGISEPYDIINNPKVDYKKLEKLFVKVKPQILHIHTFMGLPLEVVAFFKSKGVKIIFTTHDYFGLCPKVNLINNSNKLCSGPEPNKCLHCNEKAPSKYYLFLRNNSLLLKVKKLIPSATTVAIRKPRVKTNINNYLSFDEYKYELLLNYYLQFFKLIDLVLYNSTNTRDIYQTILNRSVKSRLLLVSHIGIKDNRKVKHVTPTLNIGFIGSLSEYKGFSVLKDVLNQLHKEDLINWRLNVYGSSLVGKDKDCINIKYCGKFKSSYMNQIYNDMDLLVVPSICNETFSLITLEALSYGVPTLISDKVGAKDVIFEILPDLIYTNRDNLYEKLKYILENPKTIQNYNKIILESNINFDFEDHVNKMLEYYRK